MIDTKKAFSFEKAFFDKINVDHYATAGMSAVASDFDNILVFRVLAVIAAVNLIITDRTIAHCVGAFICVVIHHKILHLLLWS